MIKSFTKSALAAGIALGSLGALSVPAAAQINGMATVRPVLVVAGSQARQAGYQQIQTTYAAQFAQLSQLAEQRQALLLSLDTDGNGQLNELDRNGDGNVDEEEQSRNPVVAQVTALDQQMGPIEAQVQMAQVFVVSQVAQQANVAIQQVLTERSVQVLLSPETVIYAVEGLDLSALVIANLDARLPTVSITPTPGWQPDEGTIAFFQQVQQTLMAAARAQQAQAAAGAPPPATEGR